MNSATRLVVLVCAASLGAAAVAAAQAPVEFRRVREGNRVEVVLDTGGECHGTVARRAAGVLEIAVDEASGSCRGRTVATVLESDTQSVTTAAAAPPSKTREKAASVAVATGVGLLATRAGASFLGVLMGGGQALRLLNRSIDRPDPRATVYVLYVARLGDAVDVKKDEPGR